MKKTLDLGTITLQKGAHPPGSLYCVMELAAYIAGEPWSDHPACVSSTIATFLVSWNDALSDADRQTLKPYAIRAIGTRTTDADEKTRAWMAVDWLVRMCAPAFLRLTPKLEPHADALEALTPLQGETSAAAAQSALDAARAAAWDAAKDATWDAGWAAAWVAAGVAAKDAAGVAAWAAARVAAGAGADDAARAVAGIAAGIAARAAAGAAARDTTGVAAKLQPIVKELQASARDLIDGMIAVGTRRVELAMEVIG